MTADGVRDVDPTSDTTPAVLNEDGCVAGDLECNTCKYNLRTLHVDGRCPECGADVFETIQEVLETPVQLIKDASIGARGLVMAGWAAVVGMVLIILMETVDLWAACGEGIYALTWIAIITSATVILIAGVSGIVGLTVHYSNVREGLTARSLSRWCLQVITLCIPIALFAAVMNIGAYLLLAVCLLCVVSVVTMWCAVLVHAGKLMHRVSHPDVALFAVRLSWGVAFVCCATSVCLVAAALGVQFADEAFLCGVSFLVGLFAATSVLFWRVMRALMAARQQMDKYAREFRARLPIATNSTDPPSGGN